MFPTISHLSGIKRSWTLGHDVRAPVYAVIANSRYRLSDDLVAALDDWPQERAYLLQEQVIRLTAEFTSNE